MTGQEGLVSLTQQEIYPSIREMKMQFFDKGSSQYNVTDKRCLYNQEFLHGGSSFADNRRLSFFPFDQRGRSRGLLFILAMSDDIINTNFYFYAYFIIGTGDRLT